MICPGPAPIYVPFTAGIPQIIRSSGLSAHQYADDVQAYVHCRAEGAVDALDRLQTVLGDLHQWMQSNRSKLNPDNLSGSDNATSFRKLIINSSLPDSRCVVFQDSVIDLGVTRQ